MYLKIFSLFVHIIEMNKVCLIIAVVNGKKHFGDQKPEKRRFAAISETVRLRWSNKVILSCVICFNTIDSSQIILAIYICSRTWKLPREWTYMRAGPSRSQPPSLLWRFELCCEIQPLVGLALRGKRYDFFKANESDYSLHFSYHF